MNRQATVQGSGWDAFLRQWNERALEIVRAGQVDFDPMLVEFARTGELHCLPATPDLIEERERALGVRFPASFRDFLRVTDGWRSPWRETGFMIRPLAEIDRLTEVAPEVIQSWQSGGDLWPEDDEYFRYGPDQDPVNYRTRYLERCLALSHTFEDAPLYLLNTAVVDDVGELEAWDLSHHLPGANRYRSFADLMEGVCLEELEQLRDWASASP